MTYPLLILQLEARKQSDSGWKKRTKLSFVRIKFLSFLCSAETNFITFIALGFGERFSSFTNGTGSWWGEACSEAGKGGEVVLVQKKNNQ